MKNTLIEAAAVLALLLLSLSSCNSGPGRYQMVVTPDTEDAMSQTHILDTHTGVYYKHYTKEVVAFNPISGEYTVKAWKKAVE